MTYNGIFVDDQDPVYAETLSTQGKLIFTFEPVVDVTSLVHKIFASTPYIVALDYRLDELPVGMQAHQTYKGSGLAQHLRDITVEKPERDFAMVLVSAESKIKNLYRPDKTAHDLFDRVYIKEDVNAQRERIRAELISLCAAYVTLRASDRKYDILTLMKGDDSDKAYVDIQDINVRLGEATAPHIASRVLFGLIDRPGILLDQDDVCAYLGIRTTTAQKVLGTLNAEHVGYRGLFADAWPRWWSHRLESWAQSIFKRRATGLPAAERAFMLSKTIDAEISVAPSPWNQSTSELISFACASCRRGTELRHSVAAFEALQPRWAKRRRICWDCVQTDQYETNDPPLVVDSSERELAERVKKLDRDSPEPGP